jgi:hypothetical protein
VEVLIAERHYALGCAIGQVTTAVHDSNPIVLILSNVHSRLQLQQTCAQVCHACAQSAAPRAHREEVDVDKYSAGAPHAPGINKRPNKVLLTPSPLKSRCCCTSRLTAEGHRPQHSQHSHCCAAPAPRSEPNQILHVASEPLASARRARPQARPLTSPVGAGPAARQRTAPPRAPFAPAPPARARARGKL